MPNTSWTRIGPVAEFDQLSAIYQAVCGRLHWFWLPISEGKRERHRTKTMGATHPVVVFDHEFLRYIEQSPETGSEFAKRVREDGARIVWVVNTRTKKYIGRVEDGVVYMRTP